MAYKIFAATKKYHREIAGKSTNNTELSNYHQWIIKKRIEQTNRKWMQKQIAKWLGIATFFLILFLGMLKK